MHSPTKKSICSLLLLSFSSFVCLTLCDPMGCSMPGSPVLHHLLQFAQFHELVMLSNHLILCHHLLFLPSDFPCIRAFPMSWLFTSNGQTIGALASASVLTMNIQSWFPLGLTGLTSLLSKGLSRVFFSTTIWNHQFGTQPSLWSSSHTHTWLLLWLQDFCQQRK